MSRNWSKLTLVAVCGAAVALAYAATASAQAQPQPKRSTPDSFSWKYGPDGKPVKKSRVVENADGSTREEVPLGGNCVRVIERTADGVKRTDKC